MARGPAGPAGPDGHHTPPLVLAPVAVPYQTPLHKRVREALTSPRHWRKQRTLEFCRSRGAEAVPERTAPCEAGLFELLPDDVLAHLFSTLYGNGAPRTRQHGSSAAWAALRAAAQPVARLAQTCTRLADVYKCATPLLRAEMIARGTTDIWPCVADQSAPYPFSAQLTRELHSEAQLRAFTKALRTVATHCATTCCSRKRLEFNARQTTARLVEVADETQSVFRAQSAAHGLVCVRHSEPGEVQVSTLQAGVVTSQSVALEGRRVVRQMQLSPDGKCLVLHLLGELAVYDLALPEGPAQRQTLQEGLLASCVEEAWFATPRDASEPLALWVLSRGTSFSLSRYTAVDTEWMLEDFVHVDGFHLNTPTLLGFFLNAPLHFQKSDDGRKILFTCVTDGLSVPTLFQDLDEVRSIIVDHAAVAGKLCPPVADALPPAQPCALGLSPTGDCLVALHFAHGALFAEVQIRANAVSFMPVQCVELVPSSPLADAASMGFQVTFSPCERYAIVLAKQAACLSSTQHTHKSMMVLDLARRRARHGVPSRTIPCIGAAQPRSIVWTQHGLVLQVKRGLLALVNV